MSFLRRRLHTKLMLVDSSHLISKYTDVTKNPFFLQQADVPETHVGLNYFVWTLLNKILYLQPTHICVASNKTKYNGYGTISRRHTLSPDYKSNFSKNIELSNMPLQTLKLKENCPVMLLRNLDTFNGLCNGTKLVRRNEIL